MTEQSNLYKRSSGLAQDVDIISDDSRQLGQTDVGSVGSAVTIETDGEPRLGEVAVHNTVDTQFDRALESSDADDKVHTAQPNYSSVESFVHSANDDMPSHEVPDGVEVRCQADPDNDNTVRVFDLRLEPGKIERFRVTNTDVLSTEGTGNINITFEV